MFGYVNINGKELSKAERARFLALYCGVCEELKGICGTKGRFVLSYDCAFLALVLNSLYEPEESKTKILCGVHPMVKHDCHRSEMTAYAADINVILAYYSCLDDWQDEGSKLKKVGADLLKKAYDTCAARRQDKAQVIKEQLGRLSKLEKERASDIDTLSSCFGQLLGEVFAYKQDKWTNTLREAGNSLGRFIYILDAWDDAAKDKRSGAFNALSSLKNESDYEVRVLDMLKCEMAHCADALESLPLVQDINLIRNVIYSGVWTKYALKRKPAGEGDK